MRALLRFCFFLLCVGVAASAGCGGSPKPPKRAVIEADVDGWGFRRYQTVLDIEVWVSKNNAKAHTASYAKTSAEKTGHLDEQDVVNAFVTRYSRPEGIVRALIVFVRRLSRESGYRVEEKKVEGVRLFQVEGQGELWYFWASKRHVVKLGGRGRDTVPGALVEAYGERYRSKLKAGSLEGPLPEAEEEPEVEQEEFDPNNPRPEWQ